MRNLSAKGIILGGVIDIVATNVLAFPLAVVAAAQVGAAQLPPAARGAAIMTALQASPSLRIAGWLLGGACSVLGGYVAARIAKRSPVANGAWSAWACVALGVYSLVAGHAPVAAWEHLAAFVVSPALGALGGYLVQRRVERPAEPPMAAATPA